MTTEHPRFASIAVALPVSKQYHYRIPDELVDVLEVGHGVLVPFGPRKVSGLAIELLETVPIETTRLKAIERLLSPETFVDVSQLEFLKWVSEYYHHPLGEVIRTALPPGMFVQSRLVCSLTSDGLTYLDGLVELSSQEAQLLSWLRDKGAQTWSRLTENLPIPGLVRLVRQAGEAGWIQLSQQLEPQRVNAQFVKIYRQGLPVSPRDVRGAAQQAIVELLSEMGETDLPSLKEALEARGRATGSLSSTLQRMIRQGLVEVDHRETWREGGIAFDLPDQVFRLTQEQEEAVRRINAALEPGEFASMLLFGVTGSGKTEVYLRAVSSALDLDRGAIVLVPEISLTPQLVGRFRARFGDRVTCLHSGLNAGERFDAWRKLRRGLSKIVVGARSAVFAPVSDLGLIVVDEEHDASFKQENGLRYSARDLAIVRAKQVSGVVVLGSATPALETMTNARRERFQLLELTTRVQERPMPDVTIVDMTRPENRPGVEDSALSKPLEEALRDTLASEGQAILLLNRRGFAPFVLCASCGGAFRCLHCDISLTYHRRDNILLCHYCGLSVSLARVCPHCGASDFQMMGQGTERLEQTLGTLFPGISIGRLDRDTTGSRDAHARILDAFRRGEQRILVGTQMVVKGHDFPGVTLVGILQADYALNLPDFRASERTFQLVTQVAGRAGRGDTPGRVFVQTYAPRHPSILFAAEHQYEGFFRHEMRIRHAYGYPPYSRLVLFHIDARDEGKASEKAREVAEVLQSLTSDAEGQSIDVLGPAPAPLTRLQQWYRWQVLLKSPSVAGNQRLVRQLTQKLELRPPGLDVRISIDVDPQNLL